MVRYQDPELVALEILAEGHPLWNAELQRAAGIGYRRARKILKRLWLRGRVWMFKVGSAKVYLLKPERRRSKK